LIFISLVSAIGAAGIPGTGLVMLTVVLNSLGLPLEGIAYIAGVDRVRELVSTVVNVLGDAVAAVYVAKKEKQIDEKQYHKVTWLE
jgi:Na+/H+-dicarboxylate symporter